MKLTPFPVFQEAPVVVVVPLDLRLQTEDPELPAKETLAAETVASPRLHMQPAGVAARVPLEPTRHPLRQQATVATAVVRP
jgi:hypothetical protein